MVDESKAGVHPDFKKKSSTGMESQIAVLIAYLFSWIGGLVIYLIEKENKFVKYSAMQALILGIFEVACIIVISVILGLIPYIGWFLFSWLGFVLAFVGCDKAKETSIDVKETTTEAVEEAVEEVTEAVEETVEEAEAIVE